MAPAVRGLTKRLSSARPKQIQVVKRAPCDSGKFTFPFFTIENMMAMDDTHIIAAVDNNLPFSSGRQLDRADDNEFILLRVPELLAAR